MGTLKIYWNHTNLIPYHESLNSFDLPTVSNRYNLFGLSILYKLVNYEINDQDKFKIFVKCCQFCSFTLQKYYYLVSERMFIEF